MELVGDDDDGLAVGAHTAQDVKEAVRLLGGEDGGRLVQDEDIRAPVENLYDFYRLLLGHRHVVDFLGGVDVKAVAAADAADLLVYRLDIQTPLVLQAKGYILSGGEHVHQFIMLVDHADAIGKGVPGGADGHRGAVYQNLPLVRKVDAGEHIHQGGLAASVLPQQGEYFTAVQGQVDAVVGGYLAEPLGDPS